MGEWERTSEKGRIERCAQSFQSLSEVFQCLPSKKEALSEEDMQGIYDTVRNNVCGNCGRRADCWGRDVQKTSRLTYELLEMMAESGSESTENEILYKKFYHHCIKGRMFREELKNCFYRARLDMMWCNRMLENRAAVADQLQETAKIIQEIACTSFDMGETDETFDRKVKYRLAFLRIRVKSIRQVKTEQGYRQIILTANTAKGHCVSVKMVADILTELRGSRFVPERDSRLTIGHELNSIHFVEETNYYMLTGTAGRAAYGQSTSGDNFAILTGSHGQVILGISDGMGTGPGANEESRTVIELLEQFLGAGFSAEAAVKMINSAMVLRRGMERFSTLDICGINLYNGKCEFMKVGAATTFIRHAGWVDAVTSKSFPVGIFREVDFERTQKILEHGDMIIMVSDGVLDALPQEEAEEILKYMILQIETENPAEFAHCLLEQILGIVDDRPADDMTILVGGFWKK
ncbi:MAG: SpoIIE family protein phosphatase [Eubacteriales bacterium]|nr:SpoIIE family protein phosphatase [Eubacteriales bacterium]